MKTIFFDVDTQLDFMLPAGALAVLGAFEIVPNLRDLTRFAAANGIQIISTADAHAEDDPEFKIWKPHCVVHTTGQQKIQATLLSKPVILGTDPAAVCTAAQIIVEKQQIDCFTNPHLRPLLGAIDAACYVVYGVATEICVACAAFGLLETGARVELVTDAIKSLRLEAEYEVLDRFRAKGGIPTNTAEAMRQRTNVATC